MKKVIASLLMLTMLSSSAMMCFARGQSEDGCEAFSRTPLEDWVSCSIRQCPEILELGCDDSGKPTLFLSGDMLVSILWHMEGSPVVDSSSSLDSAEIGASHSDAMNWAMANGIVGEFEIHGTLTREQTVTILYRYALHKGYDVSVGENTNILSYDDVFSVSEWAIPAMQWACGVGLISGNNPNLNPKKLVSIAV